MTRDLGRYEFTEAERQRTEAEMAERTARAKTAEMLAVTARAAEGTAPKGYRPEPAVEAPASFTAEWQSYIDSKVARSEWRTLKLAMEVVGEQLVKEREAMRAAFQGELDRRMLELRAEFLQNELDRERAAKRVRSVPSAKLRTVCKIA